MNEWTNEQNKKERTKKKKNIPRNEELVNTSFFFFLWLRDLNDFDVCRKKKRKKKTQQQSRQPASFIFILLALCISESMQTHYVIHMYVLAIWLLCMRSIFQFIECVRQMQVNNWLCIDSCLSIPQSPKRIAHIFQLNVVVLMLDIFRVTLAPEHY